MNRLGSMIRHRREMKGWSQAELAAALGEKTDQTQISKWETGKIRPKKPTLVRLSEKLETPIEVFFEAMEPGQTGGKAEVDLADLAGRLVRGSKFAGAAVQRWIFNEVENAFIQGGVAVEDLPDWLQELREELR